MSTITPLDAANSGSAAMGIINTNFSNLNVDKIEATQTVALTNKTIDGDLNTITDISVSSLKSNAKTGQDTKVVTGTAGATEELGKFNSDGDLVSAGVSTTTSAPSASSTDSTVPTSQAVYEAIAAEIANHEIFVRPMYNSVAPNSNPTNSLLTNWAFASIGAADTVYFNFSVPANFHTLVSAELVMIPDTTETITISDCNVAWGASGENYNSQVISTGSFTEAVTVSLVTKVRLDTRTNSPFTQIAANDIVAPFITSGTTLLRIIGLLIKYT